MSRLGVDWYLTRLALPQYLPGGGVIPPLLPAYERDRLEFRDLLELHLIADLQEYQIAAMMPKNG